MMYANVYAGNRTNNSLFASEDEVHRFNPTYTPRLLRAAFLEYGIEINTPDLNAGRLIAFDLYFEGHAYVKNGIPKFLIALENPHINGLNEDATFYENFVKAFTWDVRLHNLPNVVSILIPYPMILRPFLQFDQKNIFACLINANKAFKYPLPSNLYLERIKTIQWYERNTVNKFQLYGLGWEKATPAFDLLGKLKRLIPQMKVKLLHQKPYPSFCGAVVDKTDVLKFSKFAYCYENSSDLKNYVTEKIFDSLVCGCIPIYWGADNIHDLIPSNCFIDRRRFKNTAAVHAHLLTISDFEYSEYQANILSFLNSEAAKQFSAKRVVSIIVKNIIENV